MARLLGRGPSPYPEPAGDPGATAAAVLGSLATGACAGGALGRMATGRGLRAWDQGSRLATAAA